MVGERCGKHGGKVGEWSGMPSLKMASFAKKTAIVRCAKKASTQYANPSQIFGSWGLFVIDLWRNFILPLLKTIVMKKDNKQKRVLHLGKKTVLNLTTQFLNRANGGFGPSAECPEKSSPQASCKTCVSNVDCKSRFTC
jgi:hypothetical protein